MRSVVGELGEPDKMKKNQGCRWVFTLNNYTEDDMTQVEDLAAICKWLFFGKEIAPTTGTPHLQGAFVLIKKMRLGAVSRMLRRASLAMMRGTPNQCRVYCSKEGDVTEYGVCPVDKSETRPMREIAADAFAMDVGEAIAMLEQDAPAQMLIGGTRIKAYLKERIQPYRGKREVIWLWGASQTAKTRYAEACGAEMIGWDGKFLDFQPGADSVCFDEVDKDGGERLPLGLFLKLTDKYARRVRVMNGYQAWTPRRIFFCSTAPPEVVYPMDQYDIQVSRRITECIHTFNGWCADVVEDTD